MFFFEKGGKSYIDGALGATFRRLLKTKGKLEKKKKMSSLPPEMLKIKEKNGIFFLWGLEEMVGGVEDALVHDGLDVHSRAENVSSSSRPPSFFVLLRLKGDQSRHPLLRSQNPFDLSSMPPFFLPSSFQDFLLLAVNGKRTARISLKTKKKWENVFVHGATNKP